MIFYHIPEINFFNCTDTEELFNKYYDKFSIFKTVSGNALITELTMQEITNLFKHLQDEE